MLINRDRNLLPLGSTAARPQGGSAPVSEAAPSDQFAGPSESVGSPSTQKPQVSSAVQSDPKVASAGWVQSLRKLGTTVALTAALSGALLGATAPAAFAAQHGGGAPAVHVSEPAYHAPEPAYHAPEPVYHAPEPAYHAPVPVYHAPEQTYRAPEQNRAPAAAPRPAPTPSRPAPTPARPAPPIENHPVLTSHPDPGGRPTLPPVAGRPPSPIHTGPAPAPGGPSGHRPDGPPHGGGPGHDPGWLPPYGSDGGYPGGVQYPPTYPDDGSQDSGSYPAPTSAQTTDPLSVYAAPYVDGQGNVVGLSSVSICQQDDPTNCLTQSVDPNAAPVLQQTTLPTALDGETYNVGVTWNNGASYQNVVQDQGAPVVVTGPSPAAPASVPGNSGNGPAF